MTRALIFLCLVSVFACTKSDVSEGLSAKFEGIFKGACESVEKVHSVRSTWTFSQKDGTFMQSTVNFQDANCHIPVFSKTSKGFFQVSKPGEKNQEVLFRRVKEVWAAWNRETQQKMEELKVCGVSDWTDRVNVTGKKCGQTLVPGPGGEIFAKVAIEKDAIMLGALKQDSKTEGVAMARYERGTEWLG